MDLYASAPHYADHLWPIWQALPDAERGHAWAPRSRCWWGRPPDRRQLHATRHRLCLVAGYPDARKMWGRRLVYLEHGAGQSYDADPRSVGHGSYSGGAGLGDVALFLAPAERVADRWRATYRAPAVAVGCPKLDAWHRAAAGLRDIPRIGGLTVAVTFHWDCPMVPETRWALPHYRPALHALVRAVDAAGGRVLGHGHPRAWGALEPLWGACGATPARHMATVLSQADLLVGDNTSALPEFASTGRPVLWLNAPWYRVQVHHGGRFWEWPDGQVQVNEPHDLLDAVWRALEDPPEVRAARAAMVRSVYAYTDGHAAQRAADAILALL